MQRFPLYYVPQFPFLHVTFIAFRILRLQQVLTRPKPAHRIRNRSDRCDPLF
jgi:hypothetical protein